MNSIIVSEKLKLKVLNPLEDAEIAFSIVQINRQYLEKWLPWVGMTTCVENEINYLKGALERFQNGLGLEMGIFERNTEGGNEILNFIGMCGIVRIDRQNEESQFGEIGYWLDYEHRGQGIITKCCEKLVEFAFKTLNLNLLKIVAHQDNQASISVAKRLEFTLTDEKAKDCHPKYHRDPTKLLIFVKYRNEWANIS
ncbi:putative ribosomal N-acetyltransferase YdaF [Styela clava]